MIQRPQKRGSVSAKVVNRDTTSIVGVSKNRMTAMRRPEIGVLPHNFMAGESIHRSGQIFGGGPGATAVRIQRR